MKPPSRLRSIFKMTCPRCGQGNLFEKPFTFKTAYKMRRKCTVCQADFEPEPGYYYGAMFISYILTGWLFLGIGLTLVFGFGWSLWSTLLAVGFITLLVHNYFFRLSRSIWIHFFLKYDSKYTQKI